MKAYSKYKDSGHGWASHIPETWKMMQLKFLTENHDGKRVPVKAEDRGDMQGEYPYYGANGIIDYVNDYLFDGEYLLVGEDGAPFFLPQDVAFVASGKFWVNNHAHILKTINGSDVRFFKYSLNTVDYREYITGSTRDKLTQSDLSRIKLPIPTLPEQQAIADFLDRKTAQIDTLIEKKQRQIDLLQEQRTALINHAVTKGLSPDVRMKDSGVEWLGEIPNHWEMTTVRYFYDVKLGKMLDSNKQNGNDLVKPYLRAANIHWNKILLDEVGVNEMEFSESQLERYALQSGDLLVTEGGVTVGRSAIWNGELTECYFQNSLNRARPSKHASTKWLYYWMYFVTNNGFIDILADKSTFGHLTNEKLKALPVPIPPISEHDEIIEKLTSYEPKMEAQIILIEKQIAYLQEYRTALISEAVTGKIDVR